MAALLVDVAAVGKPAIGVGLGVSRLGLQGPVLGVLALVVIPVLGFLVVDVAVRPAER